MRYDLTARVAHIPIGTYGTESSWGSLPCSSKPAKLALANTMAQFDASLEEGDLYRMAA